jgi:hypothetical protein
MQTVKVQRARLPNTNQVSWMVLVFLAVVPGLILKLILVANSKIEPGLCSEKSEMRSILQFATNIKLSVPACLEAEKAVINYSFARSDFIHNRR